MTNFLMTYGLVFLFANVLVDQIGLPIPAIPSLIIAGAAAAEGRLPITGLFISCVVATLVAGSAWYYAGEHFSSRVMKTLCLISLTPETCVSKGIADFERWGMKSLLIADFIPGFSIIAPTLAGATRIGWSRFLLFSTLGAFLWVGSWLAVGMILKGQVEYFLMLLEDMGTIAIAIIGALLVSYITYKWWERHRFFAMLRMARISADELYRLMTSGQSPVIVDVRSQTARAFEPRRIPGALHVPLYAVDQHVKGLPRDRDIILYCTCPNEVSAAEATKLLMNSGFKRVRPLHGGLDAWIAAGYSIEEVKAAHS